MLRLHLKRGYTFVHIVVLFRETQIRSAKFRVWAPKRIGAESRGPSRLPFATTEPKMTDGNAASAERQPWTPNCFATLKG